MLSPENDPCSAVPVSRKRPFTTPMHKEVPVEANDQGPANPAQAIDIHVFEHGDEILREGEVSTCFYVILGGRVSISRRGRTIRILRAQDVFGLEAVVLKRPSSHTARSLETSRIATYRREALDHFTRQNPRMIHTILASVLRQLNQTGRNLASESDSIDLGQSRVRFFGDGDEVIREGASGKEFYRLVSTQGGLRIRSGDREVGHIHKPGEFLGEIAALTERPYPYTVTSIGESALETYTREDLDGIVRDHPDQASHLIRSLLNHVTKKKPKPRKKPVAGKP